MSSRRLGFLSLYTGYGAAGLVCGVILDASPYGYWFAIVQILAIAGGCLASATGRVKASLGLVPWLGVWFFMGRAFAPSVLDFVGYPADLRLSPARIGLGLVLRVGVPMLGGGLLSWWVCERLWLRRRRRAHGLCIECGYDLRGSSGPRCPECGTPFEVGKK